MQIKINEKYEDGTLNPGPVEVHGPNGFISGWSMSCIHEATDTSAKQYIEIGVVNHMLDAAFREGQRAKAKAIAKELNLL